MNKTETEKRATLITGMMNEAKGIDKVNSLLRIKGKRHSLALKGRNIPFAYYAAPKHSSFNNRDGKAPLLIAFHGGGFIYGGYAMDDAMWCAMAKELEVNIASIGYRKSPDYLAYDSLDDAYDSIFALKERASELGFDADHISVFGCSAGGNLAAACGLAAKTENRIKLDNQILLYPLLDLYTDPVEKGPGSMEADTLSVINELHCRGLNAKDPFISPVFASADLLKGLPNTIIAYCENDSLRQEAEKYTEKLRRAEVPVHAYFAAKMPHIFFENGFVKRIPKSDYAALGKNAKEIVESGLLKQTAQEVLSFIKNNMVS